MKYLTAVASAALFVASHAYAMDTILPNALVATATGNGGGREMMFTLPLNGDTSSCVVNLSYGEKPGIGINNDGDTNINGNRVMSRLRTYSADGVYTFTAKAKSGCTGEARVTFTIGNIMRPSVPPQERTPVLANPTPKALSEVLLDKVKLAKTTIIELSPLNADVTVVDALSKPTSTKGCTLTASLFNDKNGLVGSSVIETSALPGPIAVALTGLQVGQYGKYQLRFTGEKTCSGGTIANFEYTAGAMVPGPTYTTGGGLGLSPGTGVHLPNTGVHNGGAIGTTPAAPLQPKGTVKGLN